MDRSCCGRCCSCVRRGLCSCCRRSCCRCRSCRCCRSCHRPANVTASGPGGVIQKKSRKISNGQRGLPRRPGSSPAVEDGACQGARSDERSSLALDWRWPLPQRTVRIVSMNSVSGSVPPVPTRSVGPVHDSQCQSVAIAAFIGGFGVAVTPWEELAPGSRALRGQRRRCLRSVGRRMSGPGVALHVNPDSHPLSRL